MRSIGEQGEGLQRDLRFAFAMRALAPVALLTGLLAGCAAPIHYMGIDLVAASASPKHQAIQSLAQRANASNKPAQLELGIRFEEGRGVPQDFHFARHLYEQAMMVKVQGNQVLIPGGNSNQIPIFSSSNRVEASSVSLEAMNRLSLLHVKMQRLERGEQRE